MLEKRGSRLRIQVEHLAFRVATRRVAHADTVTAWNFDDIVVERYRYAPGAAGAIATHAHPDYQLGVSVDTPGEYTYRHACHAVPSRSISMLNPDEPHASRDVATRERPAEFWTIYLPPALVRRTARAGGTVFFADAVVTESRLFAHVAALPFRLLRAATRLERDAYLESALSHLLAHARLMPEKPGGATSPPKLERVRERLEDEAGNPTLAELAAEADLSPWRFCREFRARFGQPPHAYLLHARIRHAKRLLLAGTPLAETALRCGFADQSHFTRHFRRFVDVTPARYRADGKNVQYASTAGV
jgi:AraC-like DNA-binding protein